MTYSTQPQQPAPPPAHALRPQPVPYAPLDERAGYGPLPHSGVGIAAVVVTLPTGLALAVTLVTAVCVAVKAQSQGGSIPLEGLFEIMVCSGLLTAPLALIGLLLGLAGCNRKDRSKRLGALAVLVNGLAILVLVLGFLAARSGQIQVYRTSPYGMLGL
jgi:hypothetical protein